jgi:hypothetical protein
MATLSKIREESLRRIGGDELVKKVMKIVADHPSQEESDVLVGQSIASFRKHHPDPFVVRT